MKRIRAKMKKRSKANFLVKKLGDNYGWAVCIACMIQLFCASGLGTTGFSVYQPYLIRLGGLTNTQSSTLIMIRTFVSLLGLAFAGKLIDLFEAKRVVVTGMILCALSFVAYGTVRTFPGYCAAAALCGLAHGLAGMIPASVIITRWFNLHRGTALGICMSATGLSALVASPIITALVESVGLRTSFYAEAVFILLMGAVVWFLAYSNPECIDDRPIGSAQVQADKVYASHPAAPVLFVLMILGLALYGIPGNTMYSHVSVLYAAEDYAPGAVSLMVSLLGGTIAAGKLIYGTVADRIGMIRASFIFYTMVAVGGFLCSFAGNGSIPMAVLAVSIMGIGLAVSSVSISMYASGASTGATYAQTVTRFQLAFNLGSLLFGRVPGMIADRTGSYIPAFQIMAAAGVVSAALLLITYARILRDDADRTQNVEEKRTAAA